jgi:NitT/TauT family transport system substrate-binding protein
MKKLWVLIVAIVLIGLAIFAISRSTHRQSTPSLTNLRKVTVNEALRTILYLPLYHGIEQGFFRDAGLDLRVVTGGTATAALAAMLSGEADFAQADPMYAPISREKGSDTKVVAQVVARIAVWGVTKDDSVKEMSAASIRGKRISTHPQPMTAWTYTMQAIKEFGLQPDKDVQVISSQPGTEIAPLLSGQADFAMTLEPNVSQAVQQGAHVVLSYPKLLGDQIFTGLMAREKYITENRDLVMAVVRGYQRAMNDIRRRPDAAAISAKKYFPQLNETVIQAAVKRMIDEDVLPNSVLVSEESWKKAIDVRVVAGDLKTPSSRSENCTVQIMEAAAKEAP